MSGTNLLSPRCGTKAEAAELCGITPGQFTRWMKLGLVPGPLRGTQRWLVAEIDFFLGQVNSRAHPLKEADHYQQWKMRRDQRNAGGQHRPQAARGRH